MLRITVHYEDARTRFVIEGRLIGLWVRELEDRWHQETTSPGAPPILVELTDVRFVDEQGKRLLKLMTVSGVELRATDLMIKAIVDEITEGGRTNEEIE